MVASPHPLFHGFFYPHVFSLLSYLIRGLCCSFPLSAGFTIVSYLYSAFLPPDSSCLYCFISLFVSSSFLLCVLLRYAPHVLYGLYLCTLPMIDFPSDSRAARRHRIRYAQSCVCRFNPTDQHRYYLSSFSSTLLGALAAVSGYRSTHSRQPGQNPTTNGRTFAAAAVYARVWPHGRQRIRIPNSTTTAVAIYNDLRVLRRSLSLDDHDAYEYDRTCTAVLRKAVSTLLRATLLFGTNVDTAGLLQCFFGFCNFCSPLVGFLDSSRGDSVCTGRTFTSVLLTTCQLRAWTNAMGRWTLAHW